MTNNSDAPPDGSTNLGGATRTPRHPSAHRAHPKAPATLGYRMPAEWTPHEGTWISWPHNADTWPEDRLEAVEQAFVQAVRALCTGETVHINVLDARHERRVHELLAAGDIPQTLLDGAVRLHHIATNDAWCRDHGGLFVVRPEGPRRRAVTDWGYNAWGGKYPPYDLDDAVALKMARSLGLPRFEMDMILEGGAIDVNGAGTVLTTASCLLNENRNAGLSRHEIEQRLRHGLGVKKVVWLEGDLAGDDTDGHVDNLARFVREDAVVAVVEDDPEDTNYDALQDNLHRLRATKTLDGRPLEVHRLPMPAPVVQENRRLPASYANFYVANQVVLMPSYGDPNDEPACDAIQSLFPERRVVPIDSRDVVWGLGAWHCLTQQVPAASS